MGKSEASVPPLSRAFKNLPFLLKRGERRTPFPPKFIGSFRNGSEITMSITWSEANQTINLATAVTWSLKLASACRTRLVLGRWAGCVT